MSDCLDLTILQTQSSDHAIAVARYGVDLAIEPLNCSDLGNLYSFRDKISATASSGGTGLRPTPAELVNFGKELFAFSVTGRIKTVYDRLNANSHVRIQLVSDHPDLQSLPWEYIQDPIASPGPNPVRWVLRIVPTIGIDVPKPKKINKKDLRLLFVYSDPIDQAHVDWIDIKASIESEFKSRLGNQFEMDVVAGATKATVLNAIKAKEYDILHFAGHGDVDQNGVGRLLLLDLQSHQSVPMTSAELWTMLKGSKIRLIVLSSCNSSKGDFSKPYAVIANSLVLAGIPAVVANQFPITNSIAAEFASSFYSELFRSGDVDKAVSEGRIKLYLINKVLPEDAACIEWGIPTLYRHLGAAIIFKK